MHGQQNIKKL